MAKRRMGVLLAVITAMLCVASITYASSSDERHVEGNANQHNSGAEIHGSQSQSQQHDQPGSTGLPGQSHTGNGQQVIDPNLAYCQQLAGGRTGDDRNAYIADCVVMMQNSVGTPTLQAPAVPAIPPAVQARQIAIEFVNNTEMPVPKPKLSAPSGVCGARHSVDLQIPDTFQPSNASTPMGPLQLRARGTFTVDWGDGSRNTYTTTGAAWPQSDISHTWTERGTYTVTVTAMWSAHWSIAEYSGVIPGLATTGTVPSWQVYEAQAVLVGV